MGRCKGGMYKMKMTRERRAMATTIETWHKRLGHASKGKLARVDFLRTSINNLDSFCDPCARAKHTRLHFPTSFIKTKSLFELIHCDGGYRIPSYMKANYFLTIVDDFSRAIWIFLLKHKNEASQHLQNFHKMIEVQFEKGIKRIRGQIDERGKPGVFLGYPPGTKGYKVFDLETKRIVLSRDVNFHEKIFPFDNVQERDENETGEPMLHHECHCFDKHDLMQSKWENIVNENVPVHDNQNGGEFISNKMLEFYNEKEFC
nr:putative ribonuclease H-like domain-containing protein [Tanacetum cinerariifolium]